jgi:hypothetical protein
MTVWAWKRTAPLLAERAGFAHKKRIRAAHAEKQQIRKTCHRPNRLNLYDLTARPPRRSNFLHKERRFAIAVGGFKPPFLESE